MLQHIWQLKQGRRWDEIKQLAPAFLDLVAGEQRAWLHNVLADAFEATASQPADYRQALHHAEAALSCAEPGSFWHTWTLHKVAAYLADFGDHRRAHLAANSFLAALQGQPQAAAVSPWVYAALGRVYQYRRRPSVAAKWYRMAAEANVGGEFQERVTLLHAWALTEAGHPNRAAAVLPHSLNFVHQSHMHAVQARICLALSDLGGARAHALLAIEGSGTWRIYDTVQAAEMYFILRQVALANGSRRQALDWQEKAAALLSRWNVGVTQCLVLMLRGVGGDTLYAAVSRVGRGAVGNHRWSLTGTIP